MKKLMIKLENCFGINKMECEFDFRDKNSVLIYSPNGVMKTSFAKTFDCIAKRDKPKDLIYPERKTKVNISCDGKDINNEQIFVANAENDIDSSEKITTLLASKKLKNEYDKIYSDLDTSKNIFLKKLKTCSQSTDCEEEVIKTFKVSDNDSFFDCLERIENEVQDDKNIFNFKYNDIFDKKGQVEEFINKNRDLIQQYFYEYQKLMTNSVFFGNNDDGTSFGTYQAKKIIESVKGDTFFKARHKMVLRNNNEITSKDQLESIVNNEINRIFADEKLIEIFTKIDKAIGSNNELRSFKLALEKDKSLIPYLNDYNEFKKKVWYGYFVKLKNDFLNLLNLYIEKKHDLEQILSKAKEENKQWKDIIEIYNQRFYVPFKVSIENQDDVILKQSAANLIFSYKDAQGDYVQKEKKDILDVLSRGEKRAFFILQFLFELEVRKKECIESLIVFDDIADSFDYKNKYAIIEYLYELNRDPNKLFKQIILTHNFDFYRTIASRLDLGNNVYMAIRNHDSIKISDGEYRKDFFLYMIKNINNNKNKNKIFISLIPFVRNILEYNKGTSDGEYVKLTSCLHIKDDSRNITVGDICGILQRNLFSCNPSVTSFDKQNIIDFIKKVSEDIANDPCVDEIALENKLVLSIGIRLLAEEYMINKINDNNFVRGITSNQTRTLITKFYEKFSTETEAIHILGRVNLMTPENIHVNTFMYEPLIDMSVVHLIDLFKDVKTLK